MAYYVAHDIRSVWLAHHGVKGQKWGVRRGPPYPIKSTLQIRKTHVIIKGGKRILGSEEWVQWQTKRDKQAEVFYNKVRETDDIKTIVDVSGLSETEIKQIKRHIFDDTHIMYDNTVARFPADYDMAVAWNRLSNGHPEERDILLLKHELLERTLEHNNRWPIDKAHAQANAVYPWAQTLMNELGEDGEADGLL